MTLVERLREAVARGWSYYCRREDGRAINTFVEAADRIESLEAELEKAREALERIAAYGTVAGMHDHDRDSVLRNIARAALSHKEG